MITTKLLESNQKEIFPHPQYVKPKHKSYRQLLGLDRPKKQIYVQSDNENDDFLQKLLKEQEKEKKKKHMKKNSSRGSTRTNKNRDIKQRDRQKDKDKQKRIGKQMIQSIQLKRQKNDGAILIEKSSQTIKFSKQNNPISATQTYKMLNPNSSRHQSPTPRLDPKITMSPTVGNSPNNKHHNAHIKVDETNEVPLMITNEFTVSFRMAQTVKSEKGLKALKQSLRKSSHSLHPNIVMSHKINPQSHTVVHEFKKQQLYPDFKAKELTTKQLLAMTSGWDQLPRQPKFIRRQKLFKNQVQQQRFMRSIKGSTGKYSVPILL